MKSYSIIKQLLDAIAREVEAGANTAKRVGDALIDMLDFSEERLSPLEKRVTSLENSAGTITSAAVQSSSNNLVLVIKAGDVTKNALFPLATSSYAGVMSRQDKEKLDRIEDNATAGVPDGEVTLSSLSPTMQQTLVSSITFGTGSESVFYTITSVGGVRSALYAFPMATTEHAGAISSEDYQRLYQSAVAINFAFGGQSHRIDPNDEGILLIPVDTVPTKDSENPVISGGVYKAIKECPTLLSSVEFENTEEDVTIVLYNGKDEQIGTQVIDLAGDGLAGLVTADERAKLQQLIRMNNL